MIKWEYITRSAGNPEMLHNIHHDLNELGQDGWELINVCAVSSRVTVAYFKRPMVKEPENKDERRAY